MRQSTMRVKLLLFGQLQEAAGAAAAWREMKSGGSVGELMHELTQEGALPVGVLAVSACAVNQEYVQAGHVLREGDEVAILPPVSGGGA